MNETSAQVPAVLYKGPNAFQKTNRVLLQCSRALCHGLVTPFWWLAKFGYIVASMGEQELIREKATGEEWFIGLSMGLLMSPCVVLLSPIVAPYIALKTLNDAYGDRIRHFFLGPEDT